MNIFVLDNDIERCAQYHCDKHVVKMILETAQILCTVAGDGYKPTHKNHPCTVWARHSVDNWLWLRELCYALGREYTHRYGKTHKSIAVVQGLSVPELPHKGRTPFALAMPTQYQQGCAVASYRAYYLGEKSDMFQWTKRNKPEWV